MGVTFMDGLRGDGGKSVAAQGLEFDLEVEAQAVLHAPWAVVLRRNDVPEVGGS